VQDQALIDAAADPSRTPTRRSSFVAPVLTVYLLSRVVVFGAVVDAYGVHWTLTRFAGIWDGRYYLRIAAHGYPGALTHDAPQAAFFPLYPLLVHGIGVALGGNWALAGLATSLLTGAAACLAVGALARDRAGEEAGVRAGWLFAVAPGAAFLSPAYAEGLAISLCAVALLLLDRRRWGAAGVVGALATASSPLALPIVVAGAWAAWRSGEARAWWAPALATSGFGSYCVFLWARMGTPFGWFDAERVGWAGQHVDLLAPLRWVTRSPGITLVETVCVAIAVGGLWAMRRARVPGTWWAFTAVFLVSVMFDGGMWLTPRLLLSAVPLVPAVAVAVDDRSFRIVAASSAAVMVLALVAYTQVSTGFLFQP
jgi:hypothetical protein